MDVANLGRGLLNWGGGRLQKGLRRSLGTLERTVLHPRPTEGQLDLLRARIEAVTGLDLSGLQRLGPLGSRYPVAARTVLFREGDRGDALYAVVSGSLLVLEEGEEEEILDQVGPGALIGEMALLTGAPRRATVRAATDAVLVRMGREDLERLLAAEPRLVGQLWRHVGRRIFDDCAREFRCCAGMGRGDRMAWYDQGSSAELGAGEEELLVADQLLVLAQGQLLAEGPSGCFGVQAPAVLSLPEGTRVRTEEGAFFTMLPPFSRPPGG